MGNCVGDIYDMPSSTHAQKAIATVTFSIFGADVVGLVEGFCMLDGGAAEAMTLMRFKNLQRGNEEDIRELL